MLKRTYTLVQEKTTKNTVVYSDTDGAMGHVYIPKTELGATPPKKLQMVIAEIK